MSSDKDRHSHKHEQYEAYKQGRPAEYTHQMGTGSPYEDHNRPEQRGTNCQKAQKGQQERMTPQQKAEQLKDAAKAAGYNAYADGMYLEMCTPADGVYSHAEAFDRLENDIFPPLTKFTPNDPKMVNGRYQEDEETVHKKFEEREEFRH